MVIGLTGQSGAGKTTLCDYFVDKGFVHINCDLLARQVVEKGSKCLGELVDAFGKEILFADGTLDRRKLASFAFTDKEKLAILNSVTHRYICELIEKRIDDALNGANPACGCLLDAPTLFEAGAEKYCDVTVAVLADEKVRFSRICQRDGLTEQDAKARFKAQKPDEFFTARCTYVLYNNGTKEEFSEQIDELYKSICA